MKRLLRILILGACGAVASGTTALGEQPASCRCDSAVAPREVDEILASLPYSWPSPLVTARCSGPAIFFGYRHLTPPSFTPDPDAVWNSFTIDQACLDSVAPADSLFVGPLPSLTPREEPPVSPEAVKALFDGRLPDGIVRRQRSRQIFEDALYVLMISKPEHIEYVYWDLPEVPRIPEEDRSYAGYVKSQWLPLPPAAMKGGLRPVARINWIHDVNGGVHFSQAYISPNWYQGGSNALTLLVNFLWHVQLNPIHHPKLLFDNVVSYKLGLSSSPNDQYHNYTISEDLFQWNLKAGFKAFERWFYSFTTQFKTQFLHNYPANSPTRSASFLSPGDFNAGIGMTYSIVNKKKTIKFNASIAPLSYNLKTCIDPKVDAAQFNISPGRKTNSEIGSNAELTLDWKLCPNITYRSRLFLFSNYNYFQGDWENTLSFAINRFLSTQIYAHLRYDSSSEITSSKWKHWMLKEILSFGFAYTFSTKV